MNGQGEKSILKIRFRLPNGEEFEAQGPQEFIERERAYFLRLIAHPNALYAANPPGHTHSFFVPGRYGTSKTTCPGGSAPADTATPGQPATPYAADLPGGHTASILAPGPLNTAPAANFAASPLRLWEHLFKEDGTTLILRHKENLDPAERALLILAGARMLLQKPAYPALELAQSFKASGGKATRLDRLLAGEIQAGRILATGAKRSRTYQLTEQGFARAFSLAGKLAQTPN